MEQILALDWSILLFVWLFEVFSYLISCISDGLYQPSGLPKALRLWNIDITVKRRKKHGPQSDEKCFQILDQFKANNNGQLPCIRGCMAVLLVGFEKCHKILARYWQKNRAEYPDVSEIKMLSTYIIWYFMLCWGMISYHI